MSATAPSTTPSPAPINLASEFGKQFLSILKNEISSLTGEEMKVCWPYVVSFLQCVAANPTAFGNPAIFGPKLIQLKAELLGAQSTVLPEVLSSSASQLATMVQEMVNQAKAGPVTL